MSVEVQLEGYLKDYEMTKSAQKIGVNEVCNLFRDTEIDLTKQSSAHLLRALGIPASYFNKVGDAHQLEMLAYSERTNPDMEAMVFEHEGEIKCAGPVTEMPFNGISEILKTGMHDMTISRIKGDPWTTSSFLFEKQKFEIGDDYGIGLEIKVPAMFSTGLRISPAILQLVCSNGLVDWRSDRDNMNLRAAHISSASVMLGIAGANGVLVDKQSYYVEVLARLEQQTSPKIIEIPKVLEENQLPKGLAKKALDYAGRIGKEDMDDVPLPKEFDSMRDFISVLTYSAQSFNPATQSNMEARIWDYAAKLAA